MALGSAIAACAVRHRAALLLTLYQPPSGASDDLVEVASRSSMAIEAAMLDVLRAGRKAGEIRPGIDLETLADRLCQVLLHVSLGVFRDVRGADEVPVDAMPDAARGHCCRPADRQGARRVRRVRGCRTDDRRVGEG